MFIIIRTKILLSLHANGMISFGKVVANHPQVFIDKISNLKKNITATIVANEEDNVLPDVDDDNDLPGYYGRLNISNILNASNNDPLSEQDPCYDDLKICVNIYQAWSHWYQTSTHRYIYFYA